jgi:hypothetical protein
VRNWFLYPKPLRLRAWKYPFVLSVGRKAAGVEARDRLRGRYAQGERKVATHIFKPVGAMTVACLLALLGSAARAEPPRAEVQVKPVVSSRSELDLSAIQERTRAYEALRAQHALEGDDPLFPAQIAQLLDEAQAKAGPKPGFLRRFALPFALGPEERTRVEDARANVDEAASLLEKGAADARRYLIALEKRVRDAPNRQRVLDRLRAQREALDDRNAEAHDLLASASTGLRLRTAGLGSRALFWLRQIVGRDGPSRIAKVRGKLAEWGATRPPVLGADLTYVHGTMTPAELPKGKRGRTLDT